MQSDQQNGAPIYSPDVEPPTGTGGMRTLEPLSQSVSGADVSNSTSPQLAVPAQSVPRSNQATSSASNGYYQPWNAEKPASQTVIAPTTVRNSTFENKVGSEAKKQLVATIVIMLVGLWFIGTAAFAIVQDINAGSRSSGGFIPIISSLQILFGLGLFFRIDFARRVLMVFIVLGLLINAYSIYVSGLLLASVTDSLHAMFYALVAIVLQMAVPVVVLVLLNLRSVKSAFGQ